ncbi:MAG TPA: alkylphosphonate utilization protein [Candidatus Jeotgalicoccus stercoravium]|nr:alkylphosphonate utilization protein [Candidatus Jeotgalicoccus stercoravium]
MENTLPACPSCGSEYTYEDGNLLVCPMCHHEWTREEEEENIEEAVKDAVGNVLNDGDTVTIIKDLKIKGSSNVIKQGTKVKNIRLIDPEDGHDLDCKIPGIGQMNLKSEFVKKI